jgi:DNA-binding PadR family transcriptional regulator
MPRDTLANPVALAALGALLERPMHPYQLAAVLAGRGVPVNRGSLYDTVDAMTRAGWIEPGPAERAGARPQRTPYALTEAGRAELITPWPCRGPSGTGCSRWPTTSTAGGWPGRASDSKRSNSDDDQREPNITDDANLDGAYPRVTEALVAGVHAAKQKARRGGHGQLKVGCNSSPLFGPAAGFFADLTRAGGERFTADLDYIGFDFFPR